MNPLRYDLVPEMFVSWSGVGNTVFIFLCAEQTGIFRAEPGDAVTIHTRSGTISAAAINSASFRNVFAFSIQHKQYLLILEEDMESVVRSMRSVAVIGTEVKFFLNPKSVPGNEDLFRKAPVLKRIVNSSQIKGLL